MAIISNQGTWRALKLYNLDIFMKNLAWNLQLELELHLDKGWIKDSARWRVTGEYAAVSEFTSTFMAKINEINQA